MTFSIVGRCAKTGMLGAAVTTSSICVGSRCPWVRARVGAVVTQNVTLPSLGPMILDKLGEGLSAPDALQAVMAGREFSEYRQLAVVDRNGSVAHVTGSKTLGTHDAATGTGCVAVGNLLKSTEVPAAMVAAFEERTNAHLAARLLHALQEGRAAGGEVGPVHSAALLVADHYPWPLVDLRVDWDDEDPIARLDALWRAYEPQMHDYVTRAIDPAAAPSYGVPGDEGPAR